MKFLTVNKEIHNVSLSSPQLIALWALSMSIEHLLIFCSITIWTYFIPFIEFTFMFLLSQSEDKEASQPVIAKPYFVRVIFSHCLCLRCAFIIFNNICPNWCCVYVYFLYFGHLITIGIWYVYTLHIEHWNGRMK